MKQTDITLLDEEYEVQVQLPDSVEEIDALIGPGGTVEEARSNLLYRNWYPRVYSAVSAHITNGTFAFKKAPAVDKAGNPVPPRKLKDGTEKPVLESDIDHLRRFSKMSDENKELLGVVFREIAPTQLLYAKGDRSGGVGKVSQAALDSANGMIAGGVENVESKVEIIESRIPGYKVGRDGDGAVTAESLARAIMALEKKLLADAKKAAASVLG